MKAWDDFLESQVKELGADTVKKWLRPLFLLKFDACNLYLEARDPFQALWFEEHMRKKVLAGFLNNNNKRIRVHLSVANRTAPPRKSKIKKEEKEVLGPKQFQVSFDSCNPLFTMEGFVVSSDNVVPFCLLNEISQSEGVAQFNPVFFHGAHGSGKTHLLMAVCQKMQQKGLNAVYIRAESFTEHVVTAIRSGGIGPFRQAYRNVDVLIIDNIHVFSNKGATQEEFFHTFNTLHLAGKQIMLASPQHPRDLQGIEPRLISRFEWGITLPIEILQGDSLLQILQKRSEALQFPLHPTILTFLYETFTSGPKALVKALEALVLRTHLSEGESRTPHAALTLSLAKHYLADLIKQEEEQAATPQKIIQTTAEHYGIRPEDILGKARSRDCALPRQVAMYLCRNLLELPFTQIGDLFDRDHSTVMTSVRAIHEETSNPQSEISSSLHHLKKLLFLYP